MVKVLRADATIEVLLSGNVTVGTVAVVQNLLGVWMGSGVSGDKVAFAYRGYFSGVGKASGATWATGQALYWNDASTYKDFQTGSTGASTISNKAIAASVQGSSDVAGDIVLF